MTTMKNFKRFIPILLCMVFLSCSEINFDMPVGPKGDTGDSAYDIWKAQVEAGTVDWPNEKTDVADFLVFIKGEKGDQGEDGKSAYEIWKEMIAGGDTPDPHDDSKIWDPSNNSEPDFWNFITGRDGQTPYVGDNGDWFIAGDETGLPVAGKDGTNGATPQIGTNGNWFIDGVDTGYPARGADGADGHTPVIGNNGNWYVDGSDSGYPARGANGTNGNTPLLGTNGNWFIDGVDTGYSARGADGADGVDGADGFTPTVGANGNWFLGGLDTGYPSRGVAGVDGNSPIIGTNGNWFINGTDTGFPSRGATGAAGSDGNTPIIGTNGNWYINGADTGSSSRGTDGVDGNSPTIGSNGNWFIGGVDTGSPARGADGTDGSDGSTPIVGTNGNWFIGGVDTTFPSRGATGATGETGATGADGNTPSVGANGNWYISGTDTGVSATGADGSDGSTPIVGTNGNWFIGGVDTTFPSRGATGATGATGADGKTPAIGNNGNWYIDGTDTGVSATGADGSTPTVGTNGNWYINNADTGFPSRGVNGTNGTDGADGVDGSTPVVGTNGNWIINGVDTGYQAIGQDGADGTIGTDGKSAYNLWKEDLANRDGTSDPMKDHKTGENWDPTQNTLNDFWEYLRGADGSDGEDGSDGTDGQPGIPGQAGAVVVVVAGVPNVIAVYSQSEYGEYVRTTDGGVEYKVYGANGAAAPGAIVTGMPGMDSAKSYTADSNGSFIIPKEDLPEIQEVSQRWGKVAQVTYDGQSVESAENTYVPNQIHTRLVLDGSYINLDHLYNVTFLIERKINPDDEWEVLPNYLPEISSVTFYGALLDDKDDIASLNATTVFDESSTRLDNGGYRVRPRRFVIENKYQAKNEQAIYWDGNENYCSIKKKTPYYGEDVLWNGTMHMVPIQAAPLLVSLDLKTVGGVEPNISFASASGVFDFTEVDFTRMYSYRLTTTQDANNITRIEPTKYSEDVAKGLTPSYIYFSHESTAGTQISSSENVPSGFSVLGFEVLTPYLNSIISVKKNKTSLFVDCVVGILKKDDQGTYFIDKNVDSLPDITVTYED